MDDPLIFVRAIHFAATLSVAGVVLFNIFIAQPALRPPPGTELRAAIGQRLAWIGLIGLLLTLLSGAAWFVLVAESISDQPLASVLSDGSVLQSVLLDTDFGRDWLLRLLLIAILAGLLTAELRGKLDGRGFLKLSVVLAAAGLAGTLAWAGHGIGGVSASYDAYSRGQSLIARFKPYLLSSGLPNTEGAMSSKKRNKPPRTPMDVPPSVFSGTIASAKICHFSDT